MKLEDFDEATQKIIKQQARLPNVGTLRAKLWALIGVPKLNRDEIDWLARSYPSWALDDAMLMSSIEKSLAWDEFLVKVKAESQL